MRLLLSAVLIALASESAEACYEPWPPSCASGYGAFDDEYEFDQCRREMVSYQSDVETFLSCKRSEIEDIQSDMRRKIDDHETAVDDFNRRARQ